MKRAPYEFKPDTSDKRYWRGPEEYAQTAAIAEEKQREFPDGASELPESTPSVSGEGEGFSRRTFISLMGASVGLATLEGCRRPEEKIYPYAKRPEDLVEGKAQFYATAMPFYGTAVGLLVESHEGRPTKIEGNPRHPDSMGAASYFVQASVLELYDPDRSKSPMEKTRKATWDEAAQALRGAAAKVAPTGKGLAVVVQAHRSPTLEAQLGALKRKWPEAKVVRYEPFARTNAREGAKIASGKPLDPVYDLGKAKVVLSLDSDFLQTEGSPVKNTRGFAQLRKPGREMGRLYVAESAFTTTGASADHRFRMKGAAVRDFALAVAAELKGVGVDAGAVPAAPALDAKLAKAAKALAKDLAQAAKAGQALVIVGERQPAAVHALGHLMNQALGAVGKGVSFHKPFSSDAEGPAAMVELGQAMGKGEISTLLVLGGNPAYDAPADADFAAGMAKVATTVHLGAHQDETAKAAAWHVNRAHYLEQWSDVLAEDGTGSVIQPLIAPLHGGKTDAEVLEVFLGGSRSAYQLVQATWQEKLGALAFQKGWRKSLHEGLIAGTAAQPEAFAPAPDAAALAQAPKGEGMEVSFHPDGHAWDGRFANNSWLMELPDPMTKLTWDNGALVSPTTAKKLGLKEGDLLNLTVNGKSVKVASVIQPGQADDSIAVSVGLGRKGLGRVADGAGFDVGPLRAAAGFGFAAAQVAAGGASHRLARTQEHHSLEGRPLIREANLTKYLEEPDFVKHHEEPHPPLLSLFYDQEQKGQKWGMVIDLNSCTGCNACAVACQSENNIPIVGKDGVLRSREMHWIRVDRYFEGDDEGDPQAVMQPMPCQQCENAPCEQVCPVGATTHSPEGLNDMAYNRCIGTRYCLNNCPFKVRRFNFYSYTNAVPETTRMQFNPNVTVRSRGVMEKCTYCVQRINEAKIAAHREGKDAVADGAIQTACQQTCPAQAITFGDLGNPESEVAKKAADERQYVLLEELNIRPRTKYLGRVRNPNPELI